MPPTSPCRIVTERLVLRPTTPADADRAFHIQSNWEVARMLRMASYPPDRDDIEAWFAGHGGEWAAGEAYRFAVEREGHVIGLTDIDEIARREGELGYWFDQASWGQGYAFEAAQAVVRFAFRQIGLEGLRSGHAADNAASGNVLLKLGFRPLDTVRVASRSRGEDILQQRYALAAPAHSPELGARP